MLISEKFQQLQQFENTQNVTQISDLYAKINADLDSISNNLNFDLKKIESRLDSKFSTQIKDYQDINCKWLQSQSKEFFDKISLNSRTLTQDAINKVSETLISEIRNALNAKIQNLHNEVDTSKLINSFKNDTRLITSIKNNTISQLKAEINADRNAMISNIQGSVTSNLTNYLQSSGRLDSIIRNVIASQSFTNEINRQIKQRVQETINQTLNLDDFNKKVAANLAEIDKYCANAKLDFQNKIDAFLKETKDSVNEDSVNELIRYVESLKVKGSNSLDKFLSDLQTLLKEKETQGNNALNEFKETLNKEKETIISEFNQKLLESAPYIINEAVNNIVSLTMQNETYMNHIKDSVINKGYAYIKEFEAELKEGIKQKALEFIVNGISKEEIKEFLVNTKEIKEILKDSAYDSTKDILDHALMKDFVKNALKEKANEILKNDELLRADAEAKAIIVSMRLSAEMQSIGDVLDKLQTKYDIDNKLAILVEKEKAFKEALANAKKDLQDEINKELPKFDTKIQDAINAYDLEQDKQTDTKIDTLKNDLLTNLQDEINKILQNNGNANANITQIIDNLKLELQDLSNKLQAQENINTQQEAKIEANTKLNEAQEQKLQDFETKDKELETKLEKVEKDLNTQQQQQQQKAGGKYFIWS